MAIINGRFTAKSEEPFAVFIIGVRINRLFAVHKWWPVASAMFPMLRELTANPDLGLLSYETMLYRRGVAFVQYWKSYDHLERYARGTGGIHMKAWARFNKAVGNNGAVGIWHETYTIAPGNFEVVYGNMPKFGLGAALDHVPADGSRETARGRLKAGDSNSNIPA
ncbi:MAG: DUF4188 domain-containing protein [Rhodospirillales bacterium]|nr:DUF4188 domain-containing protein [Rhodospirillales bacterium]